MKRMITMGAFLAVFALGAASFALFGDALFGSPASASDPVEMIKEIAVEDIICDENNECETIAGTVQIKMDEADGLPDIAPDAHGLFVSRDGEMLTLGTGSIEVEVNVEIVNDNEPVTAVSAVHSGPEVQVMVTDATQIYLDTTEEPRPSKEDIEAGTMTVKSLVTPSDLSNLAQNTMVRAWGIMQDGVLVADVLVIEPIK